MCGETKYAAKLGSFVFAGVVCVQVVTSLPPYVSGNVAGNAAGNFIVGRTVDQYNIP